MKICNYLTILAIFAAQKALASDESEPEQGNINFSGYLETYYLHDFNHPPNHLRPSFTYSHNVTDKPNINLGIIKANFSSERVRANLAVGSGTYMRANYALEPKDLQKLFEANIGLKLSDTIWLDAGLLPSHWTSPVLIDIS